jgi:hypothetical protein
MSFSEESRVWVYQSNRKLNKQEEEKLQILLNDFCLQWTAHNHQLKAKAEIRYGHFIILMVDETHAGATGCSIDKSIHFLKSIEQEFNISLFDRMLFSYKEESVKINNREDFEALINKGIIKKETVVFNNLVHTKKELDTNWEIPFEKSWHADFFN